MSARPKTGLYTPLIGGFLLMWGSCLLSQPPLYAQHFTQLKVETGYVTSNDGVRLYYARVGSGSKTVIMPGRLFAFRDFQRLANGRTLIFYDMRDRGRSDALVDVSRISLQHDADDLETVREHFGIKKPDLIGFSYLGKIVVLYAIQHPDHVNRIVQIGPVARKLGTKFPETLTAGDENRVPDPAETRKIEELYNNGFAKDHPKEYCEMEWKIEQQRMVGNPANTSRIPSPCDMENEWPIHLWIHFKPLLASDQALDIPKESIAKVTVPVLTIHGRKDRNAPYGGGREWDMLLPNARLITIDGAAHMCWVEFPEIVFPSIDLFLNGQWPEQAEPVKHLELPPSGDGSTTMTTMRSLLRRGSSDGQYSGRIVGNPSLIALRQSCPSLAHYLRKAEAGTQNRGVRPKASRAGTTGRWRRSASLGRAGFNRSPREHAETVRQCDEGHQEEEGAGEVSAHAHSGARSQYMPRPLCRARQSRPLFANRC